MAIWQHQKDGATFVSDKPGALLWWGMGCLAADTTLKVKRNGVELSIFIEDLYAHFNGKDKYEIKTFIDNTIQWSGINNVFCSGKKELIKIVLKSDNFIKCTLDHRIMTTDGPWVEAGHLLINDSIYTTYREDKVIAIYKISNGQTYDITMKHSNNFVANGIIVHNSGKTYATINIIKEESSKLVLVACPKSVVNTWKKEIEKYAKNDFTVIAPTKGSVAKKAEQINQVIEYNKTPDGYFKERVKPIVVILNYEAVWRPGLGQIRDKYKNIIDNGLLKKLQWNLIVADEIQRLRTAGSKVSKFMSFLKAEKKIGLSGTPFSTPLSPYAVFRFLDKSIFSEVLPTGKISTSFQLYKLKYCIYGGFENRQVIEYINQEDLNEKIHSITHRVKTEDVIELPPFQHIPIEVEMKPQAMKAYRLFKKEALLEFENGRELTAANVLVKHLRLAQIASGTVKDDDGIPHLIDNSKLLALKDLITGIDEQIVIFTRFRAEVTQIEEMISKFGSEGEVPRTTCKIVGGCDERDKFESKEADIAIVNVASGGVGLNELKLANYSIYFSSGYDSLLYEQSLWRTRRSGSDVTKTVFYYHIIALGTIDQIIMDAINKKIDIVDAVLEDFKSSLGRN